jgi:hypothetical protein
MMGQQLSEIAEEVVHTADSMAMEMTRREFASHMSKLFYDAAKEHRIEVPVEYRAALTDVFERHFDALETGKTSPLYDKEFSLTQHAVRTYADNLAMILVCAPREDDVSSVGQAMPFDSYTF